MRIWAGMLFLLLVGRAMATPLGNAVEAAVRAEPGLAVAHWGLIVAPADGGTPCYEHDADRLFTPASNLKLVTAATAWRVLGPHYRFETDLWSRGPDLYLQGHGDPSLSVTDLQEMATHVPSGTLGDVIVDDSAFDDERLGPGWAWDDIPSDYSAEIDALCLERNLVHLSGTPLCVEPDCGYVTVRQRAADEVDATRNLEGNQIVVSAPLDQPWSIDVAVHDPALYAGTVLRSLLPGAQGSVRRDAVPSDATLLDRHLSPPLPELLAWLLKTSDNLYAEQVLKTVGHGTREAGLAQENVPGPHRIVDGSGLSRYNAVSPRQLLTVVQQSYASTPLLQALPIGGVDGSLRHRFVDDGLQGRVFAKTGSMTGVSTLSGVLVGKRGRRWAFSWMCNGYVVSDAAIKQAEDRIIETLDSALPE